MFRLRVAVMTNWESRNRTVGFRVDEATKLRMAALAAGEGKDVSNWLRDLVKERIDAVDTVEARYAQLAGELRSFRRDFATAVEALLALVGTGEALTPKKAKQWVERNLRRKV